MAEMAYLMIIPLIIIFMFGTLGVSLFAGIFDKCSNDPDIYNKYDPACSFPYPRFNYDSIFWACMTVFQVITGEDWNQVMNMTIEVTQEFYVVYFYGIVIFGMMIFINLFIALLLTRMHNEQYSGGSTEDGTVSNKWLLEDMVAEAKTFPKSDDINTRFQKLKQIAAQWRAEQKMERERQTWHDNRDRYRMAGRSLGILAVDNQLRILLHTMVHHYIFE